MRARLTIAAFLLVAAAGSPAEDFDDWYQVDVVVFKPTRTDLDAESWPLVEPEYPADLISIAPPSAFKLSQLEHVEEIPEAGESGEEAETSGSDEFLFQSQSRSPNNRRVIEAVTGVTPDMEPEPELTDGKEIETINPESAPEPMQDLTEADPLAPGTLAFARADDDSTLNGIARSLRRSSRFNVIDHKSWIQPINSEPTAIMFQTGKRYDDLFEIEGIVSFSRLRYLHVQTNLWYTIFEPKGGNANPYPGGLASNLSDETLASYPELVEVERERGRYFPARTHQMIQSRRMRSDEMHYLDHPLFGMVVRITRFEPETDSLTTAQN